MRKSSAGLAAALAAVMLAACGGTAGSTASSGPPATALMPVPAGSSSVAAPTTFRNDFLAAQVQYPSDWTADGPPTTGSVGERNSSQFWSPDRNTVIVLFAHLPAPESGNLMQNPEGIAGQARRALSSSYLVNPVKAASVNGVSGFQLSGVARPGSTTNAGGRVEMTALPDPTHNYVDEFYLYTPDAQLASTLPVYQNMLKSLEFLPAGSGQPSPVASPST